jgi:hypothetical protein
MSKLELVEIAFVVLVGLADIVMVWAILTGTCRDSFIS